MKKISTLLFLLFLCFDAPAQESPGMLPEDEVYDSLQMATFSGNKDGNAPNWVSLKPYCPTPKNQGESGSCVAWAIGYSALTIARAIAENKTDPKWINANAFSPWFIYNTVRAGQDCTSGSKFSKSLEFLKRYGDCFNRTGPPDCSAPTSPTA